MHFISFSASSLSPKNIVFKAKLLFIHFKEIFNKFLNNISQIKLWIYVVCPLGNVKFNIKNFKQALYVLMAGNSIIPEGKKKKLRATMAMQLAQLMNEYLKTSVAIIVKKENDKSLSTLFNKYSL